MAPLLSALEELCRRSPLGEKIVVVPSLAVGHQLGDALARGGTPWVNLRFETTRTLADAVAGFALARDGWTVLSRAQALAILERACDRVLDDRSYFAALRGRPGLYRAIQRSIDDLRHAGLRDLPSGAFEDPRKARDLSRILDAYEEELAARKWVDRYGVLARALAIVASGAPLPWPAETQWLITEDVELTAEESRLVSGIVPQHEPRRFATAAPIRTVRFVRAAGEENEIRHALRHAAPFDDAEIVYTTRDPYLPLAWELTSEHGIPATFAEGISAVYTRPGQAVLGFLLWLGSDYEVSHLQRIARSGAITTRNDALGPFAFARVLREARIGWQRHRYVPRIEALIARLEVHLSEAESEARRAGLQRRIRNASEALPLVHALLDSSTAVAEGEVVDAGELAKAALRFLGRFASAWNEIDAMALAALHRMLLELTRLPEARLNRAVAVDRLREAVGEIHVAASNPRPGHLHVAPVRAGGWSGRSALFVVGLGDAKHPGSGLQDPIVLDAERAELNRQLRVGGLDLLAAAPQRASARLRALFARVPQARWTLSWAELDLRERRQGFPSRDVLDVFREMRRGTGGEPTFDDLIAAATGAGFLEGSVPLSFSEWQVAERFVRDVRRPLPLSRRDEARATGQLTEYDGRISVDPHAIDPRLTGRIYSASQLERMARCPFGWFLERVLKIEPLEELERIHDQWLDPRSFGLLVHEVLERVMKTICASGTGVNFAEHSQLVREIAEERLQWWRSEVPPGTEAAWARQRGELLATCEIFLRTEERLAGTIEPRFFELAFGKGGSFSIPLGQGRSILLRGSIDRVDRDTQSGDWEVWDYKTGSLYDYHDAWDLKGGTKLQHVIYARALEQILDERGLSGRVQCSGYYFPTTKGGGAREPRTCEPGELEKALNRLCDVVGSGFFPQPDEGSCAFCPYPDVCGDAAEVQERMRRKLQANENDPVVRAWRALQETD